MNAVSVGGEAWSVHAPPSRRSSKTQLYGESSLTQTCHRSGGQEAELERWQGAGRTVRSTTLVDGRGRPATEDGLEHGGGSATLPGSPCGHVRSSATTPAMRIAGSSRTVRAEPAISATMPVPVPQGAAMPAVVTSGGRAPRRYDVFLSYSSDRRDFADWIRGRLTGHGFSVFFDRKDIHYARSFDQTIREAIEQSSVLIFIVSARSVDPDSYALYELGYAFDKWSEESRAPKRILSVVVEATDVAPRELDEMLRVRPCDVKARLATMVRRARRHDPRYRRRRRVVAGVVAGGLACVGGVALAATALLGEEKAWERPKAPSAAMSSSSTQVEAKPETTPEPRASPEVETAPGAEGAPEPEVAGLDVRTIAVGDRASLSFVSIPGGKTMLGSTLPISPDRPREPRREVEVLPFWLTRTEVTQAQWKALMSEPPGGDAQNCAVGCEPNYPVHHVYHRDAAAFANALSAHLGRSPCYEAVGREMVRVECDGAYLPWESQWEHAARAGTSTRFSFGNDVGDACDHANGRDQARRRAHSRAKMDWLTCSDGFAEMAPVASFEPNGWGLYDMHGNAWEWADVDTPGGDEHTILRGGSYLDVSMNLRSAKRYRTGKRRYPSVGFRVALDEVPEPEGDAP